MHPASPPPRASGRRRTPSGLGRRGSGGRLRTVGAAVVTALAITTALAPTGAADTPDAGTDISTDAGTDNGSAATDGPSTSFRSLLAGTWTYRDHPTGELSHYRLVLDGGGQGYWESDWTGTWQRERDTSVCHRDQPSFKDVTGNGPAFTVRYRDGCDDALWDEVDYTTGQFALSHGTDALLLVITYDTVPDGIIDGRDYSEVLTRPLGTPGPDGGPPPPEPDRGLTCGDGDTAVTVPWPDVFALVQNVDASTVLEEPEKAAFRDDPCVVLAPPVPGLPDPFALATGPGEALVADGDEELPVLLTEGVVWEVLEDTQRLVSNYPVRCWTLRTRFPLVTEGSFWSRARTVGHVTVEHTDLCVTVDVDGAHKLTNGSPITEFGPEGRRVTGWQPPVRPAVSVEDDDVFIQFNPGGIGSSGVSHFEVTGNQSRMTVQVQLGVALKLGVPGTEGLFLDLNKVLTKQYDITAEDLGGTW